MKKNAKWLWILAAVIIFALALGLVKNRIVTGAVRAALEETTGFDVKLRSLRVSLLGSKVSIRGFQLRNPEEFPETEAIDISRFLVDFRWHRIFGHRVALKKVDLAFDKLVVVKNEEGDVNMQVLRKRIEEKTKKTEPSRPSAPAPDTPSEPAPEPPATPAETAPQKEVTIDDLRVYLGEVVMKTYRHDTDEPQVQTITIDREYRFNDVKDIHKIIGQIAVDVTARTLPQIVEGMQKSFEEGGGGEKLERDLKKLGAWLQKNLDEKR